MGMVAAKNTPVAAQTQWDQYLNGHALDSEFWSNPWLQKQFNQDTKSNQFRYMGPEGPLSQQAIDYWNSPEGRAQAGDFNQVLKKREKDMSGIEALATLGMVAGAGGAAGLYGGGGAAGAASGGAAAVPAAGTAGTIAGTAGPISAATLPAVTVTAPSLAGIGTGVASVGGMGLLASNAATGGSAAPSPAPTSAATLPEVTVTGAGGGGVAPEMVEGTAAAIGSDSGIGKAEGLLSGLSSGPSNLMNKIRRMMPQQQQQQQAPVFRDWTKPMGYQEMLASSLQRRAG